MLSMTKRLAVSGLALGIIAATTGAASAQTNSLFGNSGTSGRTTGTTGGGGTTGRSGTGAGQGGLTGNALNSGIGSTQFGDLSNSTGQSGFVGVGDNAGRFVGNRNAAQQTNQLSRNFQGARAGNTNVQPGANNNTQLKIRPIHRVAFNYSPRTIGRLQSSLNTQFTKLAQRNPRFQGLTLALNGSNEVVLRGTVNSEATRKLAAAMAKLEPGVRTVKNEIVVKPSN